MTDKPTDEALENLFVEETGFDTDDFPAAIFDFARAVLAKWGTPAFVGLEPVAWYEYDGDLDAWFLAYSHNPKAKTRPLVFGDTAPQPVAREPLTPERVKEIVQGAGYDQCGIPDTERAAFINGLRHGEREHGIKGGQHGTE